MGKLEKVCEFCLGSICDLFHIIAKHYIHCSWRNTYYSSLNVKFIKLELIVYSSAKQSDCLLSLCVVWEIIAASNNHWYSIQHDNNLAFPWQLEWVREGSDRLLGNMNNIHLHAGSHAHMLILYQSSGQTKLKWAFSLQNVCSGSMHPKVTTKAAEKSNPLILCLWHTKMINIRAEYKYGETIIQWMYFLLRLPPECICNQPPIWESRDLFSLNVNVIKKKKRKYQTMNRLIDSRSICCQ